MGCGGGAFMSKNGLVDTSVGGRGFWFSYSSTTSLWRAVCGSKSSFFTRQILKSSLVMPIAQRSPLAGGMLNGLVGLTVIVVREMLPAPGVVATVRTSGVSVNECQR